jgi:hypothetical protein
MATKAVWGSSAKRSAASAGPSAPEQVYYLRPGRTTADVRRTPAKVVRRTATRVVIRYYDSGKGTLTVSVKPDRVVSRQGPNIRSPRSSAQCLRDAREARKLRDLFMDLARSYRAAGRADRVGEYVKYARINSALMLHWKDLARRLRQKAVLRARA